MIGANANALTPSQRKAQGYIRNFNALIKFAKECDNNIEMDKNPWKDEVWIVDYPSDKTIRMIAGKLHPDRNVPDPDDVKLTLSERESYDMGDIIGTMTYRLKNNILTVAEAKVIETPGYHGRDELIIGSRTLTIDINKVEII